MKERILKFIDSEGISAAEFADKIGVQRSSVSHVLNGRNNPGFAFIQKILEAFPTIDSRWLLTGSGQMKTIITPEAINNSQKKDLFSTNEDNYQKKKPVVSPNNEITRSSESQQEQIVINDKTPIQQKERQVIKVLIFYDDHTFEDFRPAK